MTTLAELRTIAQAGKHTDPAWYRVHRRLSIHVTRVALALGSRADPIPVLMMVVTLSAALPLAVVAYALERVRPMRARPEDGGETWAT